MNDQTLSQIVAWALKAAWDEDAHPRHPAGSASGGQFAPKWDFVPADLVERFRSTYDELAARKVFIPGHELPEAGDTPGLLQTKLRSLEWRLERQGLSRPVAEARAELYAAVGLARAIGATLPADIEQASDDLAELNQRVKAARLAYQKAAPWLNTGDGLTRPSLGYTRHRR